MKKELKTVKEVCKKTGLNRKLLFDYKDIVKPSGYTNGSDGYKLYSDEDIIKLQQISVFRTIGLSRTEIKNNMNESNYNFKEICIKQLDLLEKKKKEIEDQIYLVDTIMEMGNNNSLTYKIRDAFQMLKTNDIHFSDYVNKINRLLDDEIIDRHYDLFEEKIEKSLDDENCISILEKLYLSIMNNNKELTDTSLIDMGEYMKRKYSFIDVYYIIAAYNYIADAINDEVLENCAIEICNGVKGGDIKYVSQMIAKLIGYFIPRLETIIENVARRINRITSISKLDSKDSRIKEEVVSLFDYYSNLFTEVNKNDLEWMIPIFSTLVVDDDCTLLLREVLPAYLPIKTMSKEEVKNGCNG